MDRAGAVSASELSCTPYSLEKSERSPLTPYQEAKGQSVDLWGSSVQTCYANLLALSFVLIWLVCRVGKLQTGERSLPSLRLSCMCRRTVQKLEEFLQSCWRRKKRDGRKCGIRQGSGENLIILGRAPPPRHLPTREVSVVSQATSPSAMYLLRWCYQTVCFHLLLIEKFWVQTPNSLFPSSADWAILSTAAIHTWFVILRPSLSF